MAHFEWQDFLTVADPLLDAEHQAVFDIINRLADPEERRRHDVLAGVLDAMAATAAAHFAQEEAVMAEAGFPLLPAHRRTHEEFATQIGRWQERLATGWRPSLGSSVQVVMADWWVQHIVREDHQFDDFRRTGRLVRHRLAA